MNHRSNLQPCREILVKQLITLGEEKRTFLDAYFDVREPERIQMEKLLSAYTEYVQKLLLGPDELLHSVVLIGSEIRFDYIDFTRRMHSRLSCLKRLIRMQGASPFSRL